MCHIYSTVVRLLDGSAAPDLVVDGVETLVSVLAEIRQRATASSEGDRENTAPRRKARVVMNATKDNDDRLWDALAKNYRKHGLVLVLGSGISRASRIPMWKEFLVRSARHIKTPTASAVLESLIGCSFTLPVVASLLEERCERGKHQRREFIRALRTSLYEEFFDHHRLTPAVDFSRGSPARKLFIEKVRATNGGNTTLRAIGALCAIKGEPDFERNPNIHAIV